MQLPLTSASLSHLLPNPSVVFSPGCRGLGGLINARYKWATPMLASLFPIINSFRAASGPLSTRTLRTLVSYPWPEARSYTVSGRATSYVRSICSRRGPGLAKSRREMSTSSTPMKIKIDVTSVRLAILLQKIDEKPFFLKLFALQDSICPFCFIGKRKLDRAIEISKERGMNIDFDVQFHPFLLDPTLPEDR